MIDLNSKIDIYQSDVAQHTYWHVPSATDWKKAYCQKGVLFQCPCSLLQQVHTVDQSANFSVLLLNPRSALPFLRKPGVLGGPKKAQNVYLEKRQNSFFSTANLRESTTAILIISKTTDNRK